MFSVVNLLTQQGKVSQQTVTLMNRYFKVEGNQLKPAQRGVTIDVAEYRVMEDTKRYSVSERIAGPSRWLIDFGYKEDARFTIICETAADLLYALALVRTAFPATRSPRKT